MSQFSVSDGSLGFDWVASSKRTATNEPAFSQDHDRPTRGAHALKETSDQVSRYSAVLVIHMELVKGMTLRSWLDSPSRSTRAGTWTRLPSGAGAMSPQSGLASQSYYHFAEFEFGRQLLKAIADIHGSQIVH